MIKGPIQNILSGLFYWSLSKAAFQRIKKTALCLSS